MSCKVEPQRVLHAVIVNIDGRGSLGLDRCRKIGGLDSEALVFISCPVNSHIIVVVVLGDHNLVLRGNGLSHRTADVLGSHKVVSVTLQIFSPDQNSVVRGRVRNPARIDRGACFKRISKCELTCGHTGIRRMRLRVLDRVIPAAEGVAIAGHAINGGRCFCQITLQNKLRCGIGRAFYLLITGLIKHQPCAFRGTCSECNVTGDGDLRVVRIIIDGRGGSAGSYHLRCRTGRITLDMPLRG